LRHLHYEITTISKIDRDPVAPDFIVSPKSSVKYNYVLEIHNEANESIWKICSKLSLSETKLSLWTKENDWVKKAKYKYNTAKQEAYHIKIMESPNSYKISLQNLFSRLSISDSNDEILCKFKSFSGRVGSSGGLMFCYFPNQKGLLITLVVSMIWIQESAVYLFPHRPLNTAHVYALLQFNTVQNDKQLLHSNSEKLPEENIILNPGDQLSTPPQTKSMPNSQKKTTKKKQPKVTQSLPNENSPMDPQENHTVEENPIIRTRNNPSMKKIRKSNPTKSNSISITHKSKQPQPSPMKSNSVPQKSPPVNSDTSPTNEEN
jgi:hypothetical protein